VAELLSEELGLPAPDLPWHTERDRMVAIAAAVGSVAGAMAKIAGDVVLLAQSEVGEVSEGAAPGKGGSSAMPHKRNPVDAMLALAAARLALGVAPVITGALGQEHERAVGGWQAEWAALPHLFHYTGGSVERVRRVVAGLEVDVERMRANLDASGGLLLTESLTMALAERIGRPEAFELVQSVVAGAREAGITLAEAALGDRRLLAVLASEHINRTLDPAAYLGSSQAFIDRALAEYHALQDAHG
jgi:3-carboxy-cis,cis-muconate cycloisomerase